MGMDVYGTSPSSVTGEYFRRNVWGWRPLADLTCELAPGIASGCQYWHSNDGDGLDGPASTRLADALQAALDDGRVGRWVSNRDATVKLIPNESCNLCGGTGKRGDAIALVNGQDKRACEATTEVGGETLAHPRAGQTGWCNGCDGRGWSKPWATHYHVDVGDVRDFIAFLRASGGFRIC